MRVLVFEIGAGAEVVTKWRVLRSKILRRCLVSLVILSEGCRSRRISRGLPRVSPPFWDQRAEDRARSFTSFRITEHWAADAASERRWCC
jgi:hypothetical protein